MGKKKSVEPPKEKVRFAKRKRGILKKAMEMAQICKKKVFLIVHDEDTNHLITYNSHPVDFSVDAIDAILDDKSHGRLEKYDDQHYHTLMKGPYLKQSEIPVEGASDSEGESEQPLEPPTPDSRIMRIRSCRVDQNAIQQRNMRSKQNLGKRTSRPKASRRPEPIKTAPQISDSPQLSVSTEAASSCNKR